MTHNPGFLKLVEDSRARIRECTVQEVKDKMDRHHPFVLIDVREDHEFSEDHIRGARHLGKGILERDIEEMVPDRRKEIILYCGGGYRSALAADTLQRMGYENVWSMSGGVRAWRENHFPLK